MSSRHTYRNPPIRQAICAANFDECPDWSLTTPGDIWKSLREAYPAKPKQNVAAQLEIAGNAGGPNGFAVRAGDSTTQLSTKDGKRDFSFGATSLSVTSHQPYEGWENFFERLSRGVNSYLKFATPGPLKRLGVRYVNLIEFTAEEVDLGKFFTTAPQAPGNLGIGIGSFNSRVESGWDDDGTTVVHTFKSAVSPSGSPAVVLDIDVIAQWPDGNSGIDILSEFSRLRDIERQVFEVLITDEARRLFDDN